MRTILQKNGFGVAGEAENSTEGVKKYKELMPDIATIDIKMLEMTGIEALNPSGISILKQRSSWFLRWGRK